MNLRILFVSIFIFNLSILWAQSPTGCVSAELHGRLMRVDPQYAEEIEAQELSYQKFVEQSQSGEINTRSVGLNSCDDIIFLPIVVHIVHLGQAIGMGSNISDAKVISAIDAMNQRLRNQNNLGINMKIQFVLARRDPQGNPSNGINRVNGSAVTNFTRQGITWDGDGGASAEAIKDLSRWPKDEYYNVWTVHRIHGSGPNGGGIAAYANYPSSSNEYDGTVIDTDYMSASSTVLTHEIGHGFNLLHTFEGENGTNCPSNNSCIQNGDRVCDTPPHRLNDCGSSNPCSTTGEWDNSKRNYMSYCGNLSRFTSGQKMRVDATILDGPRTPLLESEGIIPAGQIHEIGILEMVYPGELGNKPICTPGLSPQIRVKNYGTATVNQLAFIPKIDGLAISPVVYNGNLLPNEDSILTLDFIQVPEGFHSFELELFKVNANMGDAYSGNNKACGSFSIGSYDALPLCIDFETHARPNGWYFDNPETEIDTVELNINGVMTRSLAVKNYEARGGNRQKESSIITQAVNLENAVSAGIYFDISMREVFICNSSIHLDVEVSTDCGLTYTHVYYRNNSNPTCWSYPASAKPLHTVARPPYTNPPSSSFVPGDESHWRRDFVDLSNYLGHEVIVKFRVTSSFYTGENLYLDNICFISCSQANPMNLQLYGLAASDSNGTATAIVTGGQAPYMYIWDVSPNSSVDSISNLPPGSYSLTVVDANGCFTTDSVTIDDLTSINVYPSSLTFLKVFPNPFSENLMIELEFEHMTSLKLSLFDAQGRKLWSADAGEGRSFSREVNSDMLNPGIYFLSAQTADGILHIPVIKRH